MLSKNEDELLPPEIRLRAPSLNDDVMIDVSLFNLLIIDDCKRRVDVFTV